MTLPTSNASQATINPFNQLLLDCQNNPKQIQSRYESHRSNRNAQQKEKLLHLDFPGWQVDEILAKLVAQEQASNIDAESNGTPVPPAPFTDHRHNLNLYARPPQHTRELIAEIHREISDVVPDIWLSPASSLHVTILEITSSRTEDEINALATHLLENGTAAELVDYTSKAEHRTRLVKPMLSYDASAMALSFLPAAGEPHPSSLSSAEDVDGNKYNYTYHHLRRDLADRVLEAGVNPGARYIVPSAHVTIARFVSRDGEGVDIEKQKAAALVERVERVNGMLKERYWPGPETQGKDGSTAMLAKGEWVIGHEEGLEFNKGTSWYGGGERVLVGKGH
ncbi:RNA ligase/cyclic nucleotide phosphodiesterase [Aspergillus californicus]